MRIAVLASGRGSNFDALAACAQREDCSAEIVLVVSDRPRAAVLERAADLGIATLRVDPGTRRGDWQAERVAALRSELRDHRVEALCLAGFMRILPAELLADFPNRVLNIHPSLLPAFPGLHAQRQALNAGVKIAGCTVHLVDQGVDTGPILCQAAVEVAADDSEDALAARILKQEHRIYPAAMRALAEGRVRVRGRTATIVTDGRA